jgi:hypothetical protein
MTGGAGCLPLTDAFGPFKGQALTYSSASYARLRSGCDCTKAHVFVAFLTWCGHTSAFRQNSISSPSRLLCLPGGEMARRFVIIITIISHTYFDSPVTISASLVQGPKLAVSARAVTDEPINLLLLVFEILSRVPPQVSR